MGTAMTMSQFLIAFVAICVFIGVFALIANKHSKRDAAKEATTVDDYVAANGEPLDVVVLDPTSGGELNAVVLVYDNELVIGDKHIARDQITSVTFNNANVPYLNNDYQLIITTTDPECPTFKCGPLGSDAERASEVVTQIAQYVPSAQ